VLGRTAAGEHDISGADLLGMRAHAKEAENYVLACNAYVDRLTRAHLAMQVEAVRLRDALKKANDQAEHFERNWYLRGHLLADARHCMLQLLACEADQRECEEVVAKLNAELAPEDADANNEAVRAA
jgi:hypothetical protein